MPAKALIDHLPAKALIDHLPAIPPQKFWGVAMASCSEFHPLLGSYQLMTTTLHSGNLHIPADLLKKHGLDSDAAVELEDRTDGILISRSQNEPTERTSLKHHRLHDLIGFLGEDPKALRTLMEERRLDREKEDRPFGT